jgi:hypothetical protein
MRVTNFVICGLAILAASCGRPTIAEKLPDGCYYAQGKPVFKIAGAHGRVLIPGEVQTFKIQTGEDVSGSYATFSPGFFFDRGDSNGVPFSVGADPDREPFRQSVKVGTRVPTIEMNWTTYGHEDAYLGKPC